MNNIHFKFPQLHPYFGIKLPHFGSKFRLIGFNLSQLTKNCPKIGFKFLHFDFKIAATLHQISSTSLQIASN